MLSFKQFILEYFTLLENRIDFLKNQFAGKLDISHDPYGVHKDHENIIDHFATHADPTKNKSHTQWILKQYQQKKIRQEDHPRIKETLSNFERYKSKLPNRDINGYKSLSEIERAVEPHLGTEKPVSKRQETKKIKEEGSELLSSENGVSVRKLKTKEATCHYGKGTKWCTAATGGKNAFDSYNKHGPLYYIEGRDENGDIKKYHYHPASYQFMDEEDDPIDISSFIKRNPEIMKHSEMKHLRAYDEKNHEDIVNDKNSDANSLRLVIKKSPHPEIRRSAINHPNHTDESLSSLGEFQSLHNDIVNHPKSGEKTLKAIAEYTEDNDKLTHDSILKHPKINSEILNILAARTLNNKTQKSIIEHPKSNWMTLYNIADSTNNPEVQKAILNHPETNSHTLFTLAKNSFDDEIHKAILNHPEVDEGAVYSVSENASNPDILKSILNHPKATQYTKETAIDNLPGEEVEALYNNHPDANIRRYAGNRGW